MQFDGGLLRSLRVARKWDQHRLAEAARVARGVGVTQSQISRYENGQEPSARNAVALAAALEVDVTEFFSNGSAPAEDDDEESDPVAALMAVLRAFVRAELAKERA